MTAFGIGELSGILGGLSLGHTWIATLKAFFSLIVAAIVLYGVWYWNEQFNKSDTIKSFIDFVKPAVWFIYVSFASWLFLSTTTVEVDFYPAFIDAQTFSQGVKVSTPDGETSLIDAEKPVRTLTVSGVPKVYSLLEVGDALSALLISKISVNDGVWDGYFANDFSPKKVFSKCAFNAVSQNYDDGAAWLCSLIMEGGGSDEGIMGYLENTLENALPSLWETVGRFTSAVVGNQLNVSVCKNLNLTGDPERVDVAIMKCVGEAIDEAGKYYSERRKELARLKEEGKLSEADYKAKLNELDQAQVKVIRGLSQLTNPEKLAIYKRWYASLFAQNLDVPVVVENQKHQTAKNLVEWFGQTSTSVFVGENLLLELFENYQKFALTVELGLLVPILLLLSMLPNASSPTASNWKYLLFAVGTYFLIKLMRVAVFLVYLIAHNYFLQNAVG